MKPGTIFIVVVFVLLVVVGIAWPVLQWFECRDMSHSVFYCVGHVIR